MKKPLLIGEDNPRHSDPRFALYPYPEGCSGDRLCRLIMGLAAADYLRRFERFNLCAGKWSAPEARRRAAEIQASQSLGGVVVLLGSKVAGAFGLRFTPFETYSFNAPERDLSKLVAAIEAGTGSPRLTYVVLPHPSGRNLLWNAPGAFERARALLFETGAL